MFSLQGWHAAKARSMALKTSSPEDTCRLVRRRIFLGHRHGFSSYHHGNGLFHTVSGDEMKIFGPCLLVFPALCLGLLSGAGVRADPALLQRLNTLAQTVCGAGLADSERLAKAFGTLVSVTDRGAADRALRREFVLRDGDLQADLQITAVAGELRRLRSQMGRRLSGGEIRPIALIDLDPGCNVMHGRQIEYDGSGRAAWLVHLDQGLEPTDLREALNPPVPAGADPEGIAVAQIDSGVNYLLPEIAARLARDRQGRLHGYDFWDLDTRPFDLDTARSPFFPLRHGTTVASILLREAPNARLIPYRYPRPDLNRMEALVDHAAAAGARVVLMPLGSNRADDWQPFRRAAERHADILFIMSAGNNGRDIDREPVYPAAFGLDNGLVVTSSDSFGRLAAGSNWGPTSVDFMAPGEGIAVTDHRGAKGVASGSSYVVPRVAALAVRLLERHPDWRAAELKDAIRTRVGPSLERGSPRLRWGWLADPADDG